MPTTVALSETHDTVPPIPEFQIVQNSHSLAIRQLQEKYPEIITTENFNMLAHKKFINLTNEIRHNIHQLRLQQAARTAYTSCAPQKRKKLFEILNSFFSPAQMNVIMCGPLCWEQSPLYREILLHIHEYKHKRLLFLSNRKKYGALQAEYNQHVAMITQKPYKTKNINPQNIIETLIQWDNVWGVASAIFGTTLYIRVGFNDIIMNDSATISAYREKIAITLAPFYITLKLDTNANVLFPSHDDNVMGLQTCLLDYSQHNIHPHQLSDSPCFGTFGQTIVDLGTEGDIVSLFAVIVAFYSQYNSQDSAGVKAINWHPAKIMTIQDPARYQEKLAAGLYNLQQTPPQYNEEKLSAAIDRYVAYSTIERKRDLSCIYRSIVCNYCCENEVSDDDDYYLDANDNRICMYCWDSDFCSTCREYHEDCECFTEDDY